MADRTMIEWCDHTANLWWGCTEVHSGCDNCYARTLARAKGKSEGWDGVRYATVGIWKDLPKWQAAAKAAGVQRRVFCGSMMDIFEKSQPVCNWKGEPMPGVETGHLRDRYLREVIPATPDLMHLLLTKRPSNILKMVPSEWLEPGGWPRHVMTGTSPVNQPTADTLIPQLLRVPGLHFLSMEPLLGPVTLRQVHSDVCEIDALTGDHGVIRPLRGRSDAMVHWVIAGGESGHGARPMHPDWVRSLRNQCEAAGVPFLFKQWGEWAVAKDHPDALLPVNRWAWANEHGHPADTGFGPFKRELDHHQLMARIGKKGAGRLLDGVEHNGFPRGVA